ncbi:hypothetical protein DXG01_010505, partial [Tephrocybe rancida]
MPDESDDEEDQLEDDEYNTVTETPNATMRPMAVRHSGPPAGVPTDHDSDDYDSEAPSSRRGNDPNEIVKVALLQKLALVGLRMQRLPWLTLGERLAHKGIRLRMWPHTLEFPGEFKYAGKGILSIPKDAARLLLASLHDETRPIIFEVVDANTRKSKNMIIVSRFMIAKLTKISELQSSDAPVIIGAPPPPDSNHPRGRRFFADRTIDEAGLSRYRQSKGDPKGGKSISSPRTRLSEVFSAPPAKKTRDSKRKAAKRSVDELGEELESEVFSAPPVKKTRGSKRKSAKRPVDELGEELESEVSSAPPAKKTRDSKRKAAERSVDELGEELESE